MSFTLGVSVYHHPHYSSDSQTLLCGLCLFPGVLSHISHRLLRTPFFCLSGISKWIQPHSNLLRFPTILFPIYAIYTSYIFITISVSILETWEWSLLPPLSSTSNLSTNIFISTFCVSHEFVLSSSLLSLLEVLITVQLIDFLFLDQLSHWYPFFSFHSTQIHP